MLNQPLNAAARQLCQFTSAVVAGAACAVGNTPSAENASKQAAVLLFIFIFIFNQLYFSGSLKQALIQFAQFCQHKRQHGIRLLQNFIIPKSQYGKALLQQIGAAFGIVFGLFHMLAAVGLNNQLGAEAGKIGNIAANGLLAAAMACFASYPSTKVTGALTSA